MAPRGRSSSSSCSCCCLSPPPPWPRPSRRRQQPLPRGAPPRSAPLLPQPRSRPTPRPSRSSCGTRRGTETFWTSSSSPQVNGFFSFFSPFFSRGGREQAARLGAILSFVFLALNPLFQSTPHHHGKKKPNKKQGRASSTGSAGPGPSLAPCGSRSSPRRPRTSTGSVSL